MATTIPPKSLSKPALLLDAEVAKSAPAAAPLPTPAPASISAPVEQPTEIVEAQPAGLAAPITEVFQPPSPPLQATTAPGALTAVMTVNLRRPASIDPLSTTGQSIQTALNPFRIAASTKVFTGIQRIQQNVGQILDTLNAPTLPPALIGALHQPDGTAAARVQIQFDPTSVGGTGSVTTLITRDDGGFTIAMPPNATVPDNGISLTAHGANGNATVSVPADRIAANGMIGVVTLPQQLGPLPVSILSALAALALSTPAPPPPAPPATSASQPCVTIGEKGSVCVQSFTPAKTTDTFPWGVFFRLVEPQMSVVTEIQPVPTGPGRFTPLAIYTAQAQAIQARLIPSQDAPATQSAFVDRVPIDQPLSVDGFRAQISGIDSTGTFSADESVPMAASLGLGYVLQMSQQWTFQGLGLGNLVYSLPLAPGEQQQIAVFERKDTSFVQESEFFSESEAMSQRALSDTSTNATFNSAFSEAMSGGSHFHTDDNSSGSGWTAIVYSSGSGNSNSTGDTNSWLQGQRDVAQQAAQTTHSSAENQASARVNASRTGMRLATASESMDVTTKIITNHNHAHALTMQYWEVHRIYDVTTAIEGLTLACLVPMQIVRFMPPGQPAVIGDPSTLNSHAAILARYSNILQHLDVLEPRVPRRLQHGLRLLAQFASDPTAMVDSSGSVAEDVITFKLQGGFVDCETISIAAVTKRSTRVGPVQLARMSFDTPPPISQESFKTRDSLIAFLNGGRASSVTLQGSLALPASLNRSDIVGFEITRQFTSATVTLTSSLDQAIQQALASLNFDALSKLLSGALAPQSVTLSASDLESLIAGPPISFFYAAIEDLNAGGQNAPQAGETYANDNLSGTVLPPQPFPVPALQIAPVLRYKDILEIEKTAQHIVRNTTSYSKVVWMSMTAEERAILLDGYTIGVPPGGLADATQMIPLLNCVQNKVLGIFGNSLIMPFLIPQEVVEQMGTTDSSGSASAILDPAQVTQALLAYQRAGFVPPHSTIALPTRGVLGEAVLGHCPSAEKLDLTRFWNWQDSPADTAPGIGMVQLPTTTPPLTTGVTAPNSLTNLPPLINNLITAPQPNTSLLQAMGQQAASQPDFNASLTGQQQLASLLQNGQSLASTARADALKTTTDLTSKGLDLVGKLIDNSAKKAPGSKAGGDQGSKPGGGNSTSTPASSAANPGGTTSTSNSSTSANASSNTSLIDGLKSAFEGLKNAFESLGSSSATGSGASTGGADAVSGVGAVPPPAP